jgi:Helix-turn-helix domain
VSSTAGPEGSSARRRCGGTIMRGRRPVGPELAEQLEGSAVACRRMRVVLETIAGVRRVQEACEQLGICEQRFETVRATAIQAGIVALEARPMGRPPKVLSEAQAQIARLQARVAELEAQLRVASVRAELAGTLPRLSARSGKRCPRSGRAKESKRSRSRPGKTSKR